MKLTLSYTNNLKSPTNENCETDGDIKASYNIINTGVAKEAVIR